MTFTLRIYTAEDQSTYTDTTATVVDQLFGAVFADQPLPLSSTSTQTLLTPDGFDIFDETGTCMFSMPLGANVGKKLT